MFLPCDYSGPHWTYAPGLVNFKIDAVFRLGQIAYGVGGNVSRRRTQKEEGVQHLYRGAWYSNTLGPIPDEVVRIPNFG